MRTTTINLADLLAEREEELETLEAAQSALIAEAEDEYGSYAETPQSVEQKFDSIENQKVELEAEITALEEVCREHKDTAFRVRRLSGGAVADIQDQIAEQSFDFDVESQSADGVPKAGYGEVLWTRRSITDAPDWVEDSPEYPNDPANLDWKVFEVLSDAVDNWNTIGETSLGNSSLRAEMESSG